MARYHQGKFKPRNPKKYKGNAGKIFYRSGWEKRVMSYFDSHPDVIQWQSEEVIVPYISPLDNRPHRYFPDFIIWMKTRLGESKVIMIEVKPYAQTIPPKKGINKKRMINETMTYVVNQAKWDAARIFCKKRGWEFETMTEKSIFGKKIK